MLIVYDSFVTLHKRKKLMERSYVMKDVKKLRIRQVQNLRKLNK